MSEDICEFTSPSIGQANYLLVIIDKHSKFILVFAKTKKSLATQEIKKIVTPTENGFELRIATIHSDGEFKSNALKEFCVIRGIRQEFTTAENPPGKRQSRKSQPYAGGKNWGYVVGKWDGGGLLG